MFKPKHPGECPDNLDCHRTSGDVHAAVFLWRPLVWNTFPAPFYDFSVILGAKMGDSLQVHVFGDPGM